MKKKVYTPEWVQQPSFKCWLTVKKYHVQRYLLKVTRFEVQSSLIYFTSSLPSLFLC